MRIDIVGAGIGGLTTAIALKQKGFDIKLYEQSKGIRPVGAGIILANNAMQVYDKLGLRAEIEKKGNVISSMNITKPDLEPISKIDLKYFESKYQVKNIAIHRGVLQHILANKLSTDEIVLDHKLNNVVKKVNDYELSFDNHDTIRSSILIGADGLNSIVRKNLFPKSKIRSTNQICWRGVVDCQLPDQFTHELNEAWGKGDRFGFVQIAKDKVYWYALKSRKKNSNIYSIDNLEDYFEAYHPVIRKIISSTPKKSIHTAEISDLKPTKVWYKDNVCLIGDAAHATTPNMGQGACQAIEDAYILAEYLDKYKTNNAFERFQKARLSKAHSIVKTSWTVGKMAHISNPIVIVLRNLLMKLIPSAISRRQSEKTFKLTKI